MYFNDDVHWGGVIALVGGVIFILVGVLFFVAAKGIDEIIWQSNTGITLITLGIASVVSGVSLCCIPSSSAKPNKPVMVYPFDFTSNNKDEDDGSDHTTTTFELDGEVEFVKGLRWLHRNKYFLAIVSKINNNHRQYGFAQINKKNHKVNMLSNLDDSDFFSDVSSHELEVVDWCSVDDDLVAVTFREDEGLGDMRVDIYNTKKNNGTLIDRILHVTSPATTVEGRQKSIVCANLYGEIIRIDVEKDSILNQHVIYKTSNQTVVSKVTLSDDVNTLSILVGQELQVYVQTLKSFREVQHISGVTDWLWTNNSKVLVLTQHDKMLSTFVRATLISKLYPNEQEEHRNIKLCNTVNHDNVLLITTEDKLLQLSMLDGTILKTSLTMRCNKGVVAMDIHKKKKIVTIYNDDGSAMHLKKS